MNPSEDEPDGDRQAGTGEEAEDTDKQPVEEPDGEKGTGGTEEKPGDEAEKPAENPDGEQNTGEEKAPDEEQNADAEGNPGGEENPDTEQGPAAAETVSGSDLNTVTAQPDVSMLATDQDWINEDYGDYYWSVLNGKLYVNGSGDYTDYGDAPWLKYADDIKTAEIHMTGMTSTAGLFKGCKNLESVALKDFDTSDVTNMRGMFQGCSSLKSIDLIKFRTQNVEIMANMFYGCSSLQELALDRLNMKNVTDASGMLQGCSNLKRADFSECRAENLIYMQQMFEGCTNLESVDLSGFHTEKVIWMYHMFTNCQNLTTINWGESFKTTAVVRISQMFFNCHSLTSLDLSGFDLKGIASEHDISSFLSSCYNLDMIRSPYNIDLSIKVYLPRPNDLWYDENGVTVTELPHTKGSSMTLTRVEHNSSDIAAGLSKGIRWRIDSSGRLTVSGTGDFADSDGWYRAPWGEYAMEITSASVNVKGMTNASGLFAGCQNMTSVDLSKFDTRSVTNMDNMFEWCSALETLDLSGFDTRNVTSMSGMFYSCEKLKKLDLTSFDTGKVTNITGMFMGCTNLVSVDLSSFDTRNVTEMGDNQLGLFGYCENLTSVDLSSFDTRNLAETSLSWMFFDCKKLKKVDLGTFDLRNVIQINGMFYGCESLEQFDFGAFINYENCWDMGEMFSGCKKLKKVTMSGFDMRHVSNMYGMFENCSSLTALAPRRTGTTEYTDMSSMFAGCSSLSNLDVSRFETGETTSMREMFRGCGKLAKLNVSGFETNKVSDMSKMFAGCSSLTSLDLSGFDAGSVSEKEDIFFPSFGMQEMFDGCTKLAVIQTPCNVPENLQNPAGLPGGTWYRTNATEAVKLPSLEYSITLTKKKPAVGKPAVTKASLKIKKTKTDYLCGEEINTADLTVTYYATDGTVQRVTDYETNIDELDTSTPGKKKLVVVYDNLTASVELSFTREMNSGNTTITVPETVYAGISRMPVPAVKMTVEGKTLTLAYGRDFKTSYENNINAGENTAAVTVTGINNYSGTLSQNFTIRKASLVIKPIDMTLAAGDKLPKSDEFGFVVLGMYADDGLLRAPSFTCDATQEDMEEPGKQFEIRYVPNSADAGNNYEISATTATLTISQERVSYKVTFDYAGHKADDKGATEKVLNYVKSGSLIAEPEKPTDTGYLFVGWYKDKACTKAWNFDTDTVQEDLRLYACWLLDAAAQPDEGEDLCIKEIPRQEYTGNQIKPTVIVYSGDAAEPLKAGRDYTVKYCNNVEADLESERNLGGVSSAEDLEDKANGFNRDLAYVVITGKGNYIGTACRNFHIDPAPVADGDGNPAKGFTFRYTEQMTVNAKKAQKPFGSLKYKKAMKAGKDYDVKLTALEAYDEANDVLEGDRLMLGETAGTTALPGIPAGWRGSFLLTVTGKGNYCGTLTRKIWVTDKSRLMKNAAVSLGKNLKNIEYTGNDITLTPAWYDTARKKYYGMDNAGNIIRRQTYAAADVFTVKFGKEYLRYGKDFSVRYTDNRAVGTATMQICGEGDYMGTKSVTFKIKGTAFNAKTVKTDENTFAKSLAYTGEALTQNGVVLRKAVNDEKLVYGRDYTISYKNNKKKGTATMTFTARTGSGYTGNFKKSFKIVTADLKTVARISPQGNTSPDALTRDEDGNYRMTDVSYQKGGTKLTGRFLLTDTENGGMLLKEGVDYTLSYANNKKVTTAGNDAVMTVKGKGNYSGAIKVYYQIDGAQWGPDVNGNLQASAAPIAYDVRKADTYVYAPKVKVTDGKAALSAGKEYIVTPHNCKQSEVREYLTALASLQESTPSAAEIQQVRSLKPYAVVTAKDGSGYAADNEGFRVDVDIYQNKLTQKNLYVLVSEDEAQTTYTKGQVRPDVTVYYGDAEGVKKAKKDKVTDENVLTDSSGQYGLKKLNYISDGIGDYTLTYGKNVAAGKNKGSVTVNGAGLYGGSVTVKFTIQRRDVYKIG